MGSRHMEQQLQLPPGVIAALRPLPDPLSGSTCCSFKCITPTTPCCKLLTVDMSLGRRAQVDASSPAHFYMRIHPMHLLLTPLPLSHTHLDNAQ